MRTDVALSCSSCKHFAERMPKGKKPTSQDQGFPHWCKLLDFGVRRESFRCGGDDYYPAHTDQWLWDQAAKAAEEWWAIQCRDMYAAVYLYYKRGELTCAKECPAGFTLGDSRRIGPSGTKAEHMHKIYETARRLPCLPVTEEEKTGRKS